MTRYSKKFVATLSGALPLITNLACSDVAPRQPPPEAGGGAGAGGLGSGGQPPLAEPGAGNGGVTATAGSAGEPAMAGSGGSIPQAGAPTQPGGGAGGAGGAQGMGGGGGSQDPGTGSSFECPADPGTFSLAGVTPEAITDALPAEPFGNGFSILEGPVWTGDALYFTHIGNDGPPPTARILKVVPGQPGAVFMADSGANGLALDAAGALLAARHADGSISRIDLANMTPEAIAAEYMAARFNSPNDLAVRSDGNIYFTDPDYQAPMPRPQAQTRVYRIDPMKTVSVIVADRQQPNGVTLSLDENSLYVAGQGPVQKHPVMADGSVGSGEQFGDVFNGDGMALDCDGNLYVANNNTVTVLDPAGTELGSLVVEGAQSATNVAFGGAERKTLYITTLGSTPMLYKAELGIVGSPY